MREKRARELAETPTRHTVAGAVRDPAPIVVPPAATPARTLPPDDERAVLLWLDRWRHDYRATAADWDAAAWEARELVRLLLIAAGNGVDWADPRVGRDLLAVEGACALYRGRVAKAADPSSAPRSRTLPHTAGARAREVARAERRAELLRLRAGGMMFRDIARTLGYSSPANAYAAWKSARHAAEMDAGDSASTS